MITRGPNKCRSVFERVSKGKRDKKQKAKYRNVHTNWLSHLPQKDVLCEDQKGQTSGKCVFIPLEEGCKCCQQPFSQQFRILGGLACKQK
jgi:hypothetical protein